MKARKLVSFLIVGAVAAGAICYATKPVPYDEQLIRIQSEQELAHIDRNILDAPLEVQGVLLDYSRDRRLVLKAWLAYSRYPAPAREILALYGEQPEFKALLLAYDESVIPVIQYFRDNDVWTVKAGNAASAAIDNAKQALQGLWDGASGKPSPEAEPALPLPPGWTEADRRGWYAVNIIRREGREFLGQFVVNAQGVAIRNHTARVAQAIGSFFTSGVRAVETKIDLGETVKAGDVAWALLDVALIAAPMRLLKVGKATEGSAKEISIASRTRVLAPRLLSKASGFAKLGRFGLFAATVYIVIAHPSLINSLFSEVAKWLGLDPLLVQFVGWCLLIALLLYPVSWIVKPLARVTYLCLTWLDHSRRAHRLRHAGSTAARDRIATSVSEARR